MEDSPSSTGNLTACILVNGKRKHRRSHSHHSETHFQKGKVLTYPFGQKNPTQTYDKDAKYLPNRSL